MLKLNLTQALLILDLLAFACNFGTCMQRRLMPSHMLLHRTDEMILIFLPGGLSEQTFHTVLTGVVIGSLVLLLVDEIGENFWPLHCCLYLKEVS